MNNNRLNKTSNWLRLPPWIILCVIIGTIVFWALMFSRDYRREHGYMRDIFLQRGEVMIHSLEVLKRQSPRSSWKTLIDDFWADVKDDKHLLFIVLTDEKGHVIHNSSSINLPPNLFNDPQSGFYRKNQKDEEPSRDNALFLPYWRLENINNRDSLVVYRDILPFPRHGKMGMRGTFKNHGGGQTGGHMEGHMGYFPNEYFIWIAFDMSLIDQMIKRRSRIGGMFIALCSLAILGGVLALFWGYNSRLNRKMYEEANAMTLTLIGRLPTGVIIKNKQGFVSVVNKATSDISGLEENDFLGKNLDDLTFNLIPKEETLSAREMDLRFKGGNHVHVSISSAPIINEESGELLGKVLLMEDQGEVGRLRAELAQKERLASLGSLAAGLAHEIRNPLGAIRGLNQHLLRKTASNSDEKEALEVMMTSVDRLNSTVTDFLEYAKPTHLKVDTLDLGDLVRKMATLAAHDALSSRVSINLDLPDHAVLINGDESRLSQAFLNLYLNAIQAAANNERGQVDISLKCLREEAIVYIRDNGPGFSPEQLSQAFVPFFTTKAEGTGLGLALVEKSIRAHSGADIILSSPPAGGALITISFKLTEKQDERKNHEPENTSIDS